MISKKLLATLLTVLALSGTARAEKIYFSLKCLSAPAGGHSTETFSGLMMADRADVRLSDSGIVVTGRDLAVAKSTVESANCRNTYVTTEEYWFMDAWRTRKVTKTRDWNAIRAHMASRTAFRTCDRGSEISIYDSRDAFLTDIFRSHQDVDSGSTISLRECLIDDLDQAQ